MAPFTLVSPPARDADGLTLATLLGEAGLAEEPGAGGARVEVFVDTPAGRLFRRGLRLHHRPEEALWVLEREGQVLARQPGPIAPLVPAGPVADALAGVSFDGVLVPQLVLQRRTRVYRGAPASADRASETADTTAEPAAALSAEPAPAPGRLVLEELDFIDPHDERETPGPRVLTLSGRQEGAPGWELGRFLLNRLAGSKAAVPDVLVEGLAALGLPLPGVPIPGALRPGPGDTMGEVIAKTLQGQALRMRGFRRGTVLDLDPEYLHQLRVASRRARAAVRFFRPWLDERAVREVSAGLKEVGQVLGRVRDIDVLVGPLRKDLDRAGVPSAIAERILHAFELRRRAGLEASIRLLESPRFTGVVEGVERLQALPGRAGEPAAERAPALLAKAARKFRKWRGRKVGSLTEDDLHRIRIAIKRLRYLGEFFSPFGTRDFPKAVRALVPYQDCLGEAQDARVAVDYLRGLAEYRSAEGRPEVAELFALGELIRRQEKRKRRRRERFKTLWREFPARSRRLRRAL